MNFIYEVKCFVACSHLRNMGFIKKKIRVWDRSRQEIYVNVVAQRSLGGGGENVAVSTPRKLLLWTRAGVVRRHRVAKKS